MIHIRIFTWIFIIINKKLARIKRIKGHRRGLYLNLRVKGIYLNTSQLLLCFAFLERLDIERISVILYILYGIIIPLKMGNFSFG